ncbi:alpha/beta fold hydrolase [Agrobacterium sp. NPDC090273]|uniref:alpha/beta fold hydrolase n=1 Tax=Agrobacterium sp. NPDC090273 TaxID=3363919 RepID=UPI00383A1447
MSMLLVPGFMLDADLWRDILPAISEFGPFVHADLSKDGSIEAMARRTLASAPERFILVGFSMGGYVAREIVRQAPERVSALVLIATSARGDTEVQRQRKASVATQKTNLAFKGLSAPAVASSLHPDNAGRSDLIERIQAMGQRLGAEVFRQQSLLDRVDEQETLVNIHCPCLVVAGENDRLRSRAETEELYHGISGSSFKVIEQTGHMIPLEAPDALAETIRQFLASFPAG